MFSLKKKSVILADAVVTAVVLAVCFAFSLYIQYKFVATALVPAIFALGVFLTSVITKGYVCGLIASFVSVFAVNFAFTFPYFKFNFTIPENILSAFIMVAITLITCGLTAKLKRHEEIRAESEREKTRANLLRAVSHDFRTPLTTIYGASSALLENKNELTEEQKDKMLESIQQDSQWLFRMLENLLSITKLGGENVKIIKSPTVLEELIDSVLLKFHKRYPRQKVHVEIPEKIVIIPMDAILIEQVIINMLDNAVLHAEGMDMLSLRVFQVSDKAVFEIEDNGSGIPDERIKDIFSGSGSYADNKRSNAGIGLSVCETIIRVHGGSIEAKNIKGGGAMFGFTLNTEGLTDGDQ